MKPKNTHWTDNSIDDFRYRISSDVLMQFEKVMTEKKIKRKELATRLNKTVGRISQVLNDPSILSLKSIIEYSRALGMKVSVVAYDDNDPTNTFGPINSEIFQSCWEKLGCPRDFLELGEHLQTATVSAVLADVYGTSSFDYVEAGDSAVSGSDIAGISLGRFSAAWAMIGTTLEMEMQK